jgi:CBS domain-containing protein
LRGITEARDPRSVTIREVMSPGIVYIYDDQDVEEAARLMEVKQIRRLPVLNRDKRLVGIVSLGDLAVEAGMVLSGEALKEISRPIHHESRST